LQQERGKEVCSAEDWENGSVMMISRWKEVVEEFKLKKREICIFNFKVQSGAWFQDGKARLRLVDILPLHN
jgi:hypothetical protein